MSNPQQQLEATIRALEAQREVLGSALVDAALLPLRTRLASLAVVQSLKQVTIVFLDVVGSTTLSQQLDPEDVQSVMDGTLERCTSIVEAHRGKVLQYAGDSLLAVFGANEALEDDPERAVRTGLALLEEGKRQAAWVLQRYGLSDFNVRVGVHTGRVLLGAGVDGEGSIRGFAVNVAARMEQSAPAGALRISHDTYRHVRGVFDVSREPPIEVKGIAEPMLTYLVQRCKPRAFRVASRGIEGIETRMIGRDAELAQLQQAFKHLYSQNELTVVTVVSEAGLGKSRLLYEFENWAEAGAERFYFFQGRANAMTHSQPYGFLRDILAWRLQIGDGDSMEVAKQKLELGITPLFLAADGADMAQAHAHLLGHLIGLDFGNSKHVKGIQGDGKQIRNRGFHAAARMFRLITAQHGLPIVLLLDDLQHADAGSIDFLNYLAQVNCDLPMLLLTLMRPSTSDWYEDWAKRFNRHHIVLGPLDRNSSRQLAGELLKKLPEVPAVLRELIVGDADGNPFYMEELVKMLIDVGAIVTDADQWQVNPEKLLATQVPQTLTGIIQARLDRLTVTEKRALQEASVIGFVFWDQALASLDASSPATLPALLQSQLITMHQDAVLDTSAANVREYVFAHQILHHVTYDTVLKRMRRDLHAKAARWLADLTGVRARDFLGAAAEHFLKADNQAQACDYFTRAAEHAAERYAHEAAFGYIEKALALTTVATGQGVADQGPGPEHPMLLWRLLDVRERTFDLQCRRTEQLADVDALAALAETLDDDRRRSEVARRRAGLAMRIGDYPGMENAARQAMALAERAGDELLSLAGQQRLALALSYLGHGSQADAMAQSGLSRTRLLGARSLEALFLNALSFIADNRLNRLAALDLDQQDLLINRELGNRCNEAIALGNLGFGWLRLGQLSQARLYLEQSVRLAHAIGDRATLPNTWTNLSQLALYEGAPQAALTHAQTALEMASAGQSPEFEAIALCSLGNAELALGQHAMAAVTFARALEVARKLDAATWYDASAGLARVALAQGDATAALQALHSPMKHLGQGGSLEGAESPYLIRLTCYQALAEVDAPRARELLQSLHAELLLVAASIPDPLLRRGFLNQIPENQAIVAAWAAVCGASQNAESDVVSRS